MHQKTRICASKPFFLGGGESGWRSGHHSRLPPLRTGFNPDLVRTWAELQSISIWLWGFFLRVLRFSSLLKIDSQLITSGCVVLCSEIINGPYSGCQRRHDYAFGPISRAAFFGLQVRVISTTDVNCLCFFINTFWEYCWVTGLPPQTPPNQRLCGAQ